MALKDIVIRIISRLQGDGTEKASKELQQLGNEAEATGAKLDDASKKTDDASKKMEGLGKSSGASSKLLNQVSGELNKIAPGMANIAGSVPIVGAAAGAFLAWKTAIDAVAAAAKEMRMSLAASLDEQLGNEINRHAKAYERMTAEMEKAIAHRRSLSQLEREAAKAASEERIAHLEADRAAAKAKLKPDDTLGAKSVDLDYDKRIATERRTSQQYDESRAAIDLVSERQHAVEMEQQLVERMQELQQGIASDLQTVSNIIKRQEKAADKADRSVVSRFAAFESMYGKNNKVSERRRAAAASEWDAPRDAAQERLDKRTTELQQRRSELEAVRNRQQELALRGNIQETQHRTSALTDQRQTSQHSTATSAHQAAIRDAEQRARIEAERERLKQAAASAQSQMSRYDSRVAGEQADVSAAQSRLASRPRGRLGHASAEQNYQTQLRELQGALAARDKYAADLTRILSDLRRKDEELAAQLKRQ